jgi:hypothetical protein
MLDWLFESAGFSLAGGALGVGCWVLANVVAGAATGAGDAMVLFQPSFCAEAAFIAAGSAIGAALIGALAGPPRFHKGGGKGKVSR